MSTYCFAERPRELFVESVARGWLAAIRDFPRLLSRDECVADAQGVPDDLRPEVCCIGEDDYAYRLLIVAAWIGSYHAFARGISDREKVVYASALKGMPPDEALALVRLGFADEGAQVAVSEAYARFQRAILHVG